MTGRFAADFGNDGPIRCRFREGGAVWLPISGMMGGLAADFGGVWWGGWCAELVEAEAEGVAAVEVVDLGGREVGGADGLFEVAAGGLEDRVVVVVDRDG